MNRFAFLIHLRTFDDIVYIFPRLKPFMPILRLWQRPILFVFFRLQGRLGFSIRSKFKVGQKVEGHILLIWLTGEQMMSINQAHRIRERVLEATLYAQNKLKCDVIGLGALTSSVTDSGEWLTRRPEVKSTITHGDSYSVCVAAEGIQRIAKLVGLDLAKATIAIVGATGLIGEGLTYQLAPLVSKELILIGRNSKKLEAVKSEAERLGNKAIISIDIEDIEEADVVITATSWPKALVGPEHLKNGAIVYEVSQPRNVSQLVIKERADVMVVDGAYVSIPDNIKFWWMGRPPHTSFACMSETIMQIMEGDFKNHIGKIDSDFVEEIRHRAEKHGFHHAPFTSFNRRISEGLFEDIAKKIRMRKNPR